MNGIIIGIVALIVCGFLFLIVCTLAASSDRVEKGEDLLNRTKETLKQINAIYEKNNELLNRLEELSTIMIVRKKVYVEDSAYLLYIEEKENIYYNHIAPYSSNNNILLIQDNRVYSMSNTEEAAISIHKYQVERIMKDKKLPNFIKNKTKEKKGCV